MDEYILSIDQGTTSSRALIFNQHGQSISLAQEEFAQYFPENGWVEHDPEDIWRSTLSVTAQAIARAGLQAKDIAGIGITNQRETTVIWDKTTGKPVYNAIVWQDRRSSDYCEQLKRDGIENEIVSKTGLLIDPYFSATKIHWILHNDAEAMKKAQAGKLCFGTIDCFLLWRLTKGQVHATDITNASRTLLYNIHDLEWDESLLKHFQVPKRLLPEVKDCTDDFGVCDKEWFGEEIPIRALIGDQQSATVGQTCFSQGLIKSTYGTGCFALMNTGTKPAESKHKLLTTIAYKIGNTTHYGLEGSIFTAGSAIQWLRDKLKIIEKASETESIAKHIQNSHGVYMVPAFTGLGAPHWDPKARGLITGLTRDSNQEHIVCATLESIVYQTYDLISAMAEDIGHKPNKLRVDGGMVNNAWFVQFLSDILDIEIEVPSITETTALGAAYLAGLGSGIYQDLNAIEQSWHCQQTFSPQMSKQARSEKLAGWQQAVRMCLSHQDE